MKKAICSIFIVVAIIIVTTAGTSFAFFSATATSEGEDISGETFTFDDKLNMNTIYKAEQLIPLSDDLVDDAIKKASNKCIDSKGYQVCSLYEITLTNSGNAQILNGYVSTSSTDYTTDNLKYQIFDSTFTKVSDVMTLSRVLNEKVYFKKGNSLVSAPIDTSAITYYLVIWLTETNDSQNEDFAKTFSGKIAFESINGSTITANFTA